MTQTTVYGVREALAELRQVDTELRRALQSELRNTAGPLKSALAAAIPAGPPLSGMAHRGRTGWTRPHRFSVRTGGRSRRGRDTIPLLRLLVMSPAVQIADMAATGRTPQGAALVANLPGQPSRYVWPAADRALPAITGDVKRVCEKIAAATSRRLLTPTPAGRT